jgi:signal transduction histidine kinase
MKESILAERGTAERAMALRVLGDRARDVAARLEGLAAPPPGDPAWHRRTVEPIGRSGYLMLYDRAGTVLLHPRTSLEGAPLAALTKGSDCAALFRAGMAGATSGACAWSGGAETGARLVAALPVPRTSLVVAAVAQTEEIVHPADRAVSVAFIDLTKSLQEQIDRATGQLRLRVILIVAAAAFAALVVGGRLAANIVRPIRELTDAVRGLGAGEVRGIVGVSLRDEIGELTRAFVQMKRDVKLAREQITQKQHELEAANREIRSLNQDLERRIAERTRELQDALDELRTLDQSKDDFIALVSHELRTPLTSILACADGLLEVGVGGSPAERDRLLSIIRDEAHRLSRLINDVLTLQRIEVGRMPFEFATVNLAHLVEKTCWTMEPAADARRVRVRFAASGDPRLRAVRADYDRIVQVMTNLLSNAIKFSPPGGVVEVGVDAVREGTAEAARVSVRDTGPGIPEKDARRVFDKFYQAELIDHHSEGSGLGLPIARSIVEEHGGRIGFAAADGGGTVFRFTLPLAPEAA